MKEAVLNKKPPCCDCKRYRRCSDVWGNVYHMFDSKKVDMVSGKEILHSCRWYRYTPFCKFEKDK